MNELLKAVCRRLSGQGGEVGSVFRLDTQYGGGKTHGLIALVHAVQGMAGVGIVAELVDPARLPRGRVRVAALDGENSDAADGLTLGDGLRADSQWGDLAYQLAVPEATAGSRTATGSTSPQRRDDPRAVRRRADAHHDRRGFGLPPQGQNPNWRLSVIVGSLLL
jgi:hypothetical protein